MPFTPKARQRLTITSLLRPHSRALALGLAAAIGEGIAGLLEPWPLKVVLDNVLRSRPSHGWLNRMLLAAGGRNSVHEFAALAVLAIAALDAVCSYGEKYVTTSVAQWVKHE